MKPVPKVLTEVVNNDLCIGCGLCVHSCPANALTMTWNDYGFLIPKQNGDCDSHNDCIKVCPFNPLPSEEVKTETEIANSFLTDSAFRHPKIGKYYGIYVGYSNQFRLTSSSGGIASYIFTELLDKGIINHVISVKDSAKPGNHYEYSVSSSKEEILAMAKTKYYPVTLANVLNEIHSSEGKIAVSGVACFIKAIRLAQLKDPVLKEKIPFLSGIICGGVKSKYYTEYLAQRAGAETGFEEPEYRIKNPESSAGDYSFGCTENKSGKRKTIRMKTVGDMWGTGLFKANACDFCDDTTTELADISLGDAWIEPYHRDGRGTSIFVTRSELADKLIKEGIKSEKLSIEELDLPRFLASQKGSFNHRHTGLSVRIKEAKKRKQPVPPKRFGNEKVSFDFKIVQKIRMQVRRKSLQLWREKPDAGIFDKKMKPVLKLLKLATLFYHAKKSAIQKLNIQK